MDIEATYVMRKLTAPPSGFGGIACVFIAAGTIPYHRQTVGEMWKPATDDRCGPRSSLVQAEGTTSFFFVLNDILYAVKQVEQAYVQAEEPYA